ncbi:MAG: DNA polymerase III subunit alpha [Gammaproteobacteria bacterium]|nr:DNA polymerase III subunit alpha [Gammaproteobacteria bacterium]
MDASFVHLRLHSEFSISSGVVRLKPLVNAVAKAAMPAVAVTDQSNLFGLVKFYRAAQSAGIKPIFGADVWIANEAEPESPTPLVLLCQNKTGYRNLCELLSLAYIEGQHYGLPTIEKKGFEGKTAGLIVLSGGRLGDVGQALLAHKEEQALELATFWQALFPDRFYIELQRTNRENEERYLCAAVDLALKLNLPVVATNDVHFLQQDEFEAHEVRVCINEGRTLDDPRRPRNYSEMQYLRTPEEMQVLFSDIPEALANSVEIAKRCTLELELGKAVLPDFPIPDGMTEDEFFRKQAHEGLERRLKVILHDITDPEERQQRRQEYDDRLQVELDVIIQMGFPGYFLIVADFIQWGKNNDVPVGPGRGSGAGSIVAYSLDITDLDPIKYELLFERFLNPERVSMPDFDIDFCMDKRDLVIDYVVKTYGRDQVSQIITYGTMAAKAVIRDVGRVMGHGYGFVDQLAKMIPFEIGMTLDKALASEEALQQRYNDDEDVQTLFDMARTLEGLTRNAGKHAGGVVIAPTALTDFSPLYCEQGSNSIVTQYDKDDVEAVGLVKFDFLGLRTLTIIDWAVKTINRQFEGQDEPRLLIDSIPLDDEATFTLLKNSATTAVFQLESRGMKDLITRLQPDSFEDIIALVALFRPGPLQSGMVDDFINRKHGRTQVVYPHPDLEPILKPTYGVILYQEQVMQIAQVLAGYSLGGADMLRRAMGKKKPEEMETQRVIFTEGAVALNVEEKTATYIFDLMEKFAGYGFNKSHSAAYALLSYQTAWLKAHHPAAFMAAVLSADMDNTDKIVTLVDECRDMKLKIRPPDLNVSVTAFTARSDGQVQYGLGAIKGVGQSAVDSIVDERTTNGTFNNLFDFCSRMNTRKVNRRTLEGLVRAGAMDELGPNRATLMASLTKAMQTAEQVERNSSSGQVDLFGNVLSEDNDPGCSADYVQTPEWSKDQRLLAEKETLGLYLTGHPITRYEAELRHFISFKIADLKPNNNQKIIIAGLVVAVRTMRSRKGDKMAFITLDDRTGRVELGLFPENYRLYRDKLIKDKLLVVEGNASVDDYSGGFRVSADRLFDIDEARSAFAKRLVITLSADSDCATVIRGLAEVLTPFRNGVCPVLVCYQSSAASAQIALGEEWKIHPADELIHRLNESMGDNEVRVVY